MFIFRGDQHNRANSYSKGTKNVIEWENNSQSLLEHNLTYPYSKDDIIFDLGDVYNKAQNNGTINRYVNSQYKILSERVKKIFIIDGNHDGSKYSGSALLNIDIYDNVEVILKVTDLEVEGKRILFCPYIEGLLLNGPYEDYIRENYEGQHFDFVLGHAALRISKVFDMSYLDIENCGVTFDHAIFGDIHKPLDEGKLHSIGSLWACNKSEVYENRFMTYDGELKSSPIKSLSCMKFETLDYDESFDSLELDPFKFYIVKIECKRSEKFKVEEEIRAKIPKNLYEMEFIYEQEEVEVIESYESDSDIEKQFFKENEFSKKVIEKVNQYRGA